MACSIFIMVMNGSHIFSEIIWFNSFLNDFQVHVDVVRVPNALPPHIMMTIFRHCPFPSFLPQKMKDPSGCFKSERFGSKVATYLLSSTKSSSYMMMNCSQMFAKSKHFFPVVCRSIF